MTYTRSPSPAARTAFVMGVIALVLAFVPLIGMLSWLLAPIAIVIGALALRHPPRALAVAGVICGILALIVCYGWYVIVDRVSTAMEMESAVNMAPAPDAR